MLKLIIYILIVLISEYTPTTKHVQRVLPADERCFFVIITTDFKTEIWVQLHSVTFRV